MRHLFLLSLLALLVLSNQALGEDDGDDDIFVAGPDWVPELRLATDAAVTDLFVFMARVDGPNAPCSGPPLLERPLPAPDRWACVRLINATAQTGIWRIDFEGTLGAGYRFELAEARTRRVVLATAGPGAASLSDRVTAGRRLASLPIVLRAGQSADLFVQIATPADILDADPVLRPEAAFDDVLQRRAHGFGALFGASVLLLLIYVSIARLLHSVPARRYAVYFAATTLAVASNEGYLNAFVPGNPNLAVGALDKALEAAQISAHLFFMAAFLREGTPTSRLISWLRGLGWAAGAILICALFGSYALGGAEGLIRYYDLGFELDPLLEDPFSSWPLLAGAVVSASWYSAVLICAGTLVTRRAPGGVLFAVGSVTLVFGMVVTSFSEELFADLGDDNLLPQFVLLFDGLIFAAAMVLQTFGLRDERDQALRQELAVTQDKIRLTETLLDARQDLGRARALAETHRSRLALTGHDLRQPLTSLHLALSEAEQTNPELGRTLRSSLEYLSSVLNATVADTRPEGLPDTEAEDDGGYHTANAGFEPVDVEILFANAVRMFAKEAQTKGLALRYDPTDLRIETIPVTVIRILSNLVSNAVKYTDTGEVVLRASRTAGHVTLEVCDTGAGLSADEITQIQQRYVRGDNVGDVAGDGLGLSSVQDFATSLGASLVIRSNPGQGACFALEGLPEALS